MFRLFCVLYFGVKINHFCCVVIDWTKYDLNKAKDLAKRFGKSALNEMAFNLSKMSLVDKGNLLESLKYSVRSKDGEVDRIVFSYEWYGKIHETGAVNIFGKGANLKASNWRSNAIDNHINTLNNDFAEFYAELLGDEIQIDSVKMVM